MVGDVRMIHPNSCPHRGGGSELPDVVSLGERVLAKAGMVSLKRYYCCCPPGQPGRILS